MLLVEIERTPTLESHFRNCLEVGRIDNLVANDEDGAALVRCDSPAEQWSILWPKLRRYY